jgi:hypothetical protein
MSKSTTSSGTDKEVMLKDVVVRLTTIEDIIRALQPMHEQVSTLQAMVADQQQQQVAFNITLTRVETTVGAREGPRRGYWQWPSLQYRAGG